MFDPEDELSGRKHFDVREEEKEKKERKKKLKRKPKVCEFDNQISDPNQINTLFDKTFGILPYNFSIFYFNVHVYKSTLSKNRVQSLDLAFCQIQYILLTLFVGNKRRR